MFTARKVRLWYRIHKWSSLVCVAFLLMACLTGLPLIFHDELGAVLQPHVAPASVPDGTPPASVDRMIASAQAMYPKLHPYNVYWDDDEPRVLVTMSPSEQPKAGEPRVVIYDLHTGSVLGAPNSKFDFISYCLLLHRELFLGLRGELVMGTMALSFLISLVSGALVYGPFMRRLQFGTYRRGAARRTRWFDLHNLLGIVTLTWAMVVGATGVLNAISDPLFGIWRAHTFPQLIAPYRGKPVPTHFGSVDDAARRVSAALPWAEVSSVFFPNSIYGSPRHYIVWATGKTPVTSRLFTPVLVDVSTGKMTFAGALPWYLRSVEVSRPLHFGDYGGMPLKIIWALFDIALIVVLFSGVYLWLSRRRTPVETELDRLVKLEELSSNETLVVGVLTQ